MVNDCFYFLLHRGEPLLAYQILKVAESYFASRNDMTEYYVTKQTGERNLHLEVNQVLINCPKTYDAIANCLRDAQGEIYSQSSIEHRIKNEVNLC